MIVTSAINCALAGKALCNSLDIIFKHMIIKDAYECGLIDKDTFKSYVAGVNHIIQTGIDMHTKE